VAENDGVMCVPGKSHVSVFIAVRFFFLTVDRYNKSFQNSQVYVYLNLTPYSCLDYFCWKLINV
jgi:hypothetical protein